MTETSAADVLQAAARVREFVRQWRIARGLDPEVVHSIFADPAAESADLTIADLLTLASAAGQADLPPIDPDIDWNAYYVQEGRHEGTPCTICGREVSGDAVTTAAFIEWHPDGMLIVPIGTSGEFPNTVPIGPECARRFPAEYVGRRS